MFGSYPSYLVAPCLIGSKGECVHRSCSTQVPYEQEGSYAWTYPMDSSSARIWSWESCASYKITLFQLPIWLPIFWSWESIHIGEREDFVFFDFKGTLYVSRLQNETSKLTDEAPLFPHKLLKYSCLQRSKFMMKNQPLQTTQLFREGIDCWRLIAHHQTQKNEEN